jgi:hypothetical protein
MFLAARFVSAVKVSAKYVVWLFVNPAAVENVVAALLKRKQVLWFKSLRLVIKGLIQFL